MPNETKLADEIGVGDLEGVAALVLKTLGVNTGRRANKSWGN